MQKLNKYFDFLASFIIFTIVGFVFLKNYSSGTFLSGWDNLIPELNLKLNIWRSVNAVWQEYQGLGLLGGMAHAADLSRQLILLVFSFFVQQRYLRYLWTFLMFFFGPLGVYLFISRIIVGKKDLFSFVSGLSGSIFYIFNLATLQYFFVPFETFVSFYGFFPWFLYFALNYLETGREKTLLVFLLISFLGTSSFYVQTMFLVYMVSLSVFVIEAILRLKIKGFVRSLGLLSGVFLVNSFWLLPAIYFTITNSFIPGLSHINSIATPETQLMNEAAGNFKNIISLKGYWFNYYDYFLDGKFDYMYRDWIPWVGKYWVFVSSAILFSASVFGFIVNLLRKNFRHTFSFIVLFFLSLLMLGSINPPLGGIYIYISEKIPLFSDIFRNVFTKWSVISAFVIACGLGYFVSSISLLKSKLKYLILIILSTGVIGLSLYTVFPFFKGKLISEKMRVNISTEYFKMFDWFNNKSDGGRIVNLPFINHWGWSFNNWGYNGSGFIWYGIKNPILDRTFDVWSLYNESFYNQASFALYNKDLKTFESILEKYQVKYLLLDESIINAGASEKLLYIPETKDLLSRSEHISRVQSFGFLNIYETDFEVGNNNISVSKSYVLVNNDQTYSEIDPLYSEFGTYIADKSSLMFPFINFDKRSGLELFEEEDHLYFGFDEVTAVFPIENEIAEDFSEERGFEEGYNCDLKKVGNVYKENRGDSIWYKAENGGVSCDFFDYSNLEYNQGYVLKIKGSNLRGRSLKIYLYNKQTSRMDLEELLPNGEFEEYFVILPKTLEEEKGYSLNLETRSFGRIASENIIQEIEFIPVDINLLMDLVTEGEIRQGESNLEIEKVIKVGTSHYFVDIEGGGLILLGTGYEEGWKAYSLENDKYMVVKRWLPWFFGKELKHVKVNSWANGWTVEQGSKYVSIVFWPQYLEWLGMVLGVGTLVFIVFKKKTVDRRLR